MSVIPDEIMTVTPLLVITVRKGYSVTDCSIALGSVIIKVSVWCFFSVVMK